MNQDEKCYCIEKFHVLDLKCQPQIKYYIREILDVGSHEYTSSKLNSQQRREIIAEFGIEKLTAILDACFNDTGKNPAEYNAEESAALAVLLLDAARKKVEEGKSRPDGAN